MEVWGCALSLLSYLSIGLAPGTGDFSSASAATGGLGEQTFSSDQVIDAEFCFLHARRSCVGAVQVAIALPDWNQHSRNSFQDGTLRSDC
jgi:hypothetical protein